jgi:hypothetical protein
MENKIKKKLRRRGTDLYKRYFFNSNNVIEAIIKQHDNKELINETNCEVIFDIPISLDIQRYELIMYYPNKLKEIKYINEEVINNLYSEYGETISIMKEAKIISNANVRGKIIMSASQRAKANGIEFNLIAENILLVRYCPLLKITLEYGNSKATNNSASIDRIDNTKGYIKGNIQVVSMLANSMKGSASPEQLITFSKRVLEIYKN